MIDIVKLIKEQPDFYAFDGASEKDIRVAEKSLNLSFASDYREYVKALGAASFTGHELTGICNAKRLNVVTVTLEERQYTPVPHDWYVIEQANIDGIVLWQSAIGAIYITSPNGTPKQICNSLTEYIKAFLNGI